MHKRILLLPGDGIGLEVVPQAVKVLRALDRHGLRFTFTEAPIGGAGVDAAGRPGLAAAIETAVRAVLPEGLRTADIATPGTVTFGCAALTG